LHYRGNAATTLSAMESDYLLNLHVQPIFSHESIYEKYLIYFHPAQGYFTCTRNFASIIDFLLYFKIA
jgi:hypothetical protein